MIKGLDGKHTLSGFASTFASRWMVLYLQGEKGTDNETDVGMNARTNWCGQGAAVQSNVVFTRAQ